MKTIKPLIALFSIFILLSFNGCKKDDTEYDVYFWTSMSPSDAGDLMLYINNEKKGTLPYVSTQPECDNDTLLATLLYSKLRAGKYTYKVKDSNNNLKVKTTDKYKNNTFSGSGGGIGGGSTRIKDNCIVVGFFY